MKRGQFYWLRSQSFRRTRCRAICIDRLPRHCVALQPGLFDRLPHEVHSERAALCKRRSAQRRRSRRRKRISPRDHDRRRERTPQFNLVLAERHTCPARRNITVNAVCPGYTDTDLVRSAIANITAKTGRGETEALAELVSHNPQRRLVTPDEVADAVRWLCLRSSASITGQSVAVAGGEVM